MEENLLEDPLGGFIAEVENNSATEEVSVEPVANRYAQLCKEAQLNIEDEIPAPPVAIFVGNSPACTLGNFSASIGKAKGKKTFNVSAMVAAALTNSTVLEYRGNMPSNQSVILYFDTEQSTYHAQRVFKRIARLTGFSHLEMKQRIQFFALRRYSVEDRIAMIDHKIRTTPNVGLVVIDGIRDLMLDINNPRESTVVVGLLMQWTEEHNLHVHTIIHQNKGDETARGHIGTEIEKAVKRAVTAEKKAETSNAQIAKLSDEKRELHCKAYPERYRLSSGADLIGWCIPNRRSPHLSITTQFHGEEFRTAHYNLSEDLMHKLDSLELTPHEVVNMLLEPWDQIHESQHHLLAIALQTAGGGLPTAHVGTGGGGSTSDLPWRDRMNDEYRKRRTR